MKLKIKFKITLGAICFAILFTACGQKQPEDIGEDLKQMEEGKTGETKGEGINAMLAVDEEEWVDSVSLGSKTINIDAKVVIPDVDTMKVISLADEMDENYKKNMLEKLCDQPYILNEMNPPQWYIDKNIENVKNAVQAYRSGTTDASDKEYYEYQIRLADAWDKRDGGAFQDKIPDNYMNEAYYGEYKGNMYEIVIGNGVISWRPADYLGMTQFQSTSGNIVYGSWGLGDGTSIEGMHRFIKTMDNQCKISSEDAQKMAEDFIQNLGFTHFSLGRIDALVFQDAEEAAEEHPAEYIDGYQFIFYRDIDGITLNQQKSIFGCLKHGSPDKSYSQLEILMVAVTDTGVIEINGGYLHEEKEVLTENTKLLSYQQVKDVFMSVLSGDPAYFEFIASTETLNMLELTYYMMEEGDTSVIVPVWRLSQQKEHYEMDAQENVVDEVTYAVMINAIDGSVIDPGPLEEQ